MKIFVNEMPAEPKRCLFAKKKRCENTHTGEYEWLWFCNVSGALCDFENNNKCNKLRIPLSQE